MQELPYNISLILAYKEDTAERGKNLELFKDYYTRLLPYGEIIIEETDSEVFNKCELYNKAFSKAQYNTVCFIDSDIFVSDKAIETAYKHAQGDNNVVIGYSGDAVYMSYKFKETVKRGFTYTDLIGVVPPHNTLQIGQRTDMYWVGHTSSPGGCLMMTKKCFRDINGFNPNFKNWGYEDDEILCRAHILKKNVVRLNRSQDNILLHLPHIMGNKDRSQHKYYEANRDICTSVKSKTYDELKDYIATWEIKRGDDKQDVLLMDTNFTGDKCTCRGQVPSFFNWNRSDVDSKSIFFTDNIVPKISQYSGHQLKVAWLLEPRAIFPHVYEFIKNNHDKFDYIITYDDKLLDIDENKFLPYVWGNCWVEGYVNLNNIQNKTKLVSTIASSKGWTVGHKMRHDAIRELSLVTNEYVDVYGPDYIPHPKPFDNAPWANKVTTLEDYMFSITIENSQQDVYFTEKIIDCFATKTIPIYWGTKKISQHFDADGIIFFETINELGDILTELTEEKYMSMLAAVESNYRKYKDYIIPEDYIYNNYQLLFK